MRRAYIEEKELQLVRCNMGHDPKSYNFGGLGLGGRQFAPEEQIERKRSYRSSGATRVMHDPSRTVSVFWAFVGDSAPQKGRSRGKGATARTAQHGS